MRFSVLGEKFVKHSGILGLMEDLGSAMARLREDPSLYMLGGGNPASIPEMQSAFEFEFRQLVEDPQRFEKAIGHYDPPQGGEAFRREVADYFRRTLGWKVSAANIAVTNGSQSSAFMLFNLLGGPTREGGFQKILFPLVPEYIGYADQSMSIPDFFEARIPRVDRRGEYHFKYEIDFSALDLHSEVSALCLSRPTNPSGNVVTTEELEELICQSRKNKNYLICDNAYGEPFPGIQFEKTSLPFEPELSVHFFSFSKFGLPSMRTGIVVGPEELIAALSRMNAILSLAPGGFAPELLRPWFQNSKMSTLARNTIRPFYETRARQAESVLVEELSKCGVTFRLHHCQGSLFLWLWLEGFAVSSQQIYEHLKKEGIIVVSGHYFFPGLAVDWRHQFECLRLNYAHEPSRFREAARKLASSLRNLQENPS